MIIKIKRLLLMVLDKIHFLVISVMSDNLKFKYIYKIKYWRGIKGGSLSGTGSDVLTTKVLSEGLDKFIKSHDIKSITDIPCGDFNWIHKLDLNNIKYYGYDVVPEIIESNNKNKLSENIRFEVKDLKKDSLTDTDLIIIRDLFFHLKIKDIKNCLNNLRRHKFKYIAVTNYPHAKENIDKIMGDRWRPYNLMKAPFNLDDPYLSISDPSSPNSIKTDKQLSIWMNIK